METLYDATVYPTPILKMIWQSGPVGVAIANRWMMGWPERVMKLLGQEMYQDAFRSQLQKEQEALARTASVGQSMSAEVAAMAGVSLEPPEV